MKKLTTLALASLISITASASNWTLVVVNEEKGLYLIDNDSIVNQGGTTKAFINFLYKEIKTLPTGELADSLVFLAEYDCTNPRKYRTLSGRFKYDDKVILSSDESALKWSVIYPDTAMQDLANYVCSKW